MKTPRQVISNLRWLQDLLMWEVEGERIDTDCYFKDRYEKPCCPAGHIMFYKLPRSKWNSRFASDLFMGIKPYSDESNYLFGANGLLDTDEIAARIENVIEYYASIEDEETAK